MRRACLAIAAVFGAWLASGFIALRHLRAREPLQAEQVPDELAAQAEVVRLQTSDGEELGAWFLAAARNEAPSVIELHGMGGGRRSRLGATQIMRERGCAVLLVTLRAHGDSSGERHGFGWDERRDVVAAVEWLERRRPGHPILVHGASLGAAAAVLAANELGGRVSGYALECLYADLDRGARTRCERELPPILDLAAYGALRVAAAIAWSDWERNRPIDTLATISPRAGALALRLGRSGGARRGATRTVRTSPRPRRAPRARRRSARPIAERSARRISASRPRVARPLRPGQLNQVFPRRLRRARRRMRILAARQGASVRRLALVE